MTKTAQELIYVTGPAMETLNRFVQLLNMEDYWSASLIEGRQRIGGDYRPIRNELRRLVRAWSDSGPNVSKLLDADPGVARAVSGFQAFFIPTNSGVARLACLSVPEYQANTRPLEIALGLFLAFLLNPCNRKLGGPCKHCRNYYLKKTERKKTVYCSERCGHRHTSRLANEKRRDLEHNKQLERVEELTARWLYTKTPKPWKEWVSERAPVIKKHWLTRAVRNGELTEPRRQSG